MKIFLPSKSIKCERNERENEVLLLATRSAHLSIGLGKVVTLKSYKNFVMNMA